jgi:hypothetical protein
MAPRLNQPVFLGRHRQAPLIDQVSDVAEWLVDGAPATSGMDQTLKKLCEDLCARGVPLWRVGLFVRTLHPDYFGYAGSGGTAPMCSSSRGGIASGRRTSI